MVKTDSFVINLCKLSCTLKPKHKLQAESGPPFCALVQDFCYSTLDRFLGTPRTPHV